jgi:hypothetical protein
VASPPNKPVSVVTRISRIHVLRVLVAPSPAVAIGLDEAAIHLLDRPERAVAIIGFTEPRVVREPNLGRLLVAIRARRSAIDAPILGAAACTVASFALWL